MTADSYREIPPVTVVVGKEMAKVKIVQSRSLAASFRPALIPLSLYHSAGRSPPPPPPPKDPGAFSASEAVKAALGDIIAPLTLFRWPPAARDARIASRSICCRRLPRDRPPGKSSAFGQVPKQITFGKSRNFWRRLGEKSRNENGRVRTRPLSIFRFGVHSAIEWRCAQLQLRS
jgi:hypothetical protein